ncbi:GDP-mannose 4,6-dehydratase [uncultured Desulfobulbus sp.]|uniref:GDP-mannose 4,6-dehydratase n=1 Tax=uncultured Desulfobulbus sp. TaxID=239745 RepID=UPI0029C91169|nr:GDP-mannose 4,6-dehydratase [uncultured Desulfobulbus sp.]
MKKALITGVTGQDGSYLAELLLDKGYEVHGIKRRSSVFNTERVDHLFTDDHTPDNKFFLHYGDLADGTNLRRVIEKVQPDEIYNLGAQSHVRVSFDQPEYTADIVATGALRLLEAARDYINISGQDVRIYQASSSEMFGAAPPPQSENTQFHPRSPYAVSKVAAYWYGVNYRESYNMFVCNGILFNHESPRRGETFATRKVTRAAARIKMGLQDKLYMGNLDSYRDWGFAGDFVEAMWMMLQHDTPDDYVVATGKSHTVKELVELAFKILDMDWKEYVEIDPRYYRPAEVDYLKGDYSKVRETLGWEPKVSFEELIKMMVENDLEIAHNDKIVLEARKKR